MKNNKYAKGDSTILEKLIVAYGLEKTLKEIAHICDGNANYVPVIWLDKKRSSTSWIRKGNLVRIAAAGVKEEIQAFALEEAEKRGKTFASDLLIDTARSRYLRYEKERKT